jgi:dihydroneopterin aldolase / 2-amino-4-hydroxy-6-hydroxymethyldihydropteridine diphosphokinase
LKLEILKTIEKQLGRRRTKDKYASRTIDLDLIVYGNLHLSTKNLTLPDPEIERRPFLIVPLNDLDPDLTLPSMNKSVAEIAAKFADNKMVVLEDFTDTLQHFVGNLRV